VRGARRVTAGLADQVVIASANAGTTLLALALLDLDRAGVLLLALGIAYLVMYLNRAFVGDVLLALAPRYDGAERAALVRDGLAAAAAVGVAAGAVLAAVGALWPAGGGIDLRDLRWVAPFLPLITLHDTGRCALLAARQPQRALVIDLVWVGAQAAGVLAVAAAARPTAGQLLACWGLGATAGALAYLARAGERPWRGDPRRWVGRTRHLSGWFTATAVVAQLQVQAVAFLVTGGLSQAALSALRGAQAVLLQPVQNFIAAVSALLVPRAARLVGEAAGGAAAAALRRQTGRVAAGLAGLAAALVAVAVPVAGLVLPHLPKFADLRPLVLPMAVQGGVYLVQVPFTAALRGMHRAGMLFVQYLVFAAASLTALVAGARWAGLAGAAWGLTAGAGVGLLVTVGMYGYALRRLRDSPAGPAEPDRPEPAEPAGAV
jgi:O-antigen/teichoic acid export membrane protein